MLKRCLYHHVDNWVDKLQEGWTNFTSLYNEEARMTDPRSYSRGFGNVDIGQEVCLSIRRQS